MTKYKVISEKNIFASSASCAVICRIRTGDTQVRELLA